MSSSDAILRLEVHGGRLRNYLTYPSVTSGNSIDAMKSVLTSHSENVITGAEWLNFKYQSNEYEDIKPFDSPSDYGGWYCRSNT